MLKRIERRGDGTAQGVAEHDHETRPELLGGELDAPDLRRGDDIARDADHEEVADSLVEDVFDGHARVRAAEHDGERLLAFRDGLVALGLPAIILGGIYSGTFTATEAAAVAVVYALFVEVVVYRSFGLKALIAAIIGGIGSVPGALLGGLAIGLFETFWSAYLPIEARDIALYGTLVAFLVFRPGGFLGTRDPTPRQV